jgi:Tfp pilus assembly protein FimT
MEILTVVILLSIILSVALPSADNFFVNQSVAAQAGVLVGDIRAARAWAMSNQVFTRLVFSVEEQAWVVQEVTDTTGEPIVGEPTEGLSAASATDISGYDVQPTYWRSIIDDQNRTVDPKVTLSFTPATPAAVFFRPDGMLMSSPKAGSLPLGVQKVRFSQDDVAVEVTITPAGAVESTAWFEEGSGG